jgi:hypothetical protein
MTHELSYVDPPKDIKTFSSSEGGHVKGVITYMVMDDLQVKPMSAISATTLHSKFNVRDVGAVEEKAVDFGMDEVSLYLQQSNASFVPVVFSFVFSFGGLRGYLYFFPKSFVKCPIANA